MDDLCLWAILYFHPPENHQPQHHHWHPSLKASHDCIFYAFMVCAWGALWSTAEGYQGWAVCRAPCHFLVRLVYNMKSFKSCLIRKPDSIGRDHLTWSNFILQCILMNQSIKWNHYLTHTVYMRFQTSWVLIWRNIHCLLNGNIPGLFHTMLYVLIMVRGTAQNGKHLDIWKICDPLVLLCLYLISYNETGHFHYVRRPPWNRCTVS